MNSGSTFGQLRQTPPISGRSSPLPPKPSAPTSKPSTPANDSFANLVSFNSSNSGKNVSLAERQRQLIEQKSREERERKKRLDDQYGGNNGQFWDNLEKAGQPNPNPFGSSMTQDVSGANTSRQDDDEDDLLAAFNASAPVDTSTNFPIPSATPSSLPDRSNDRSTAPVSLAEDDDDPFGLAEFNARQPQKPERSPQLDDDDILGPLAKPVSDFPQPEQREPTPVAEEAPSPPTRHSPEDKAIAELVEMGFPIDKARVALSTTESGTNIQQAVGWLLNQAHHESREKARSRDTGPQGERSGASSRNRNSERRTEFSDDFGSSADPRRGHGQPPFRERSSNRNDTTDEKDPTQLASEFGNNLFKSANSLWKTGTKKVQRAVQDFNSVPDPSQPRWMRGAAGGDRPSSQEKRVNPQQQQRYRENRSSGSENVTDEAMMLETARASPQPEARPRRETEENFRQTPRTQRPQPAHGQQHGIRPDRSQASVRAEPRLRPSRFDADEQASQAYVSPARRRKAAGSVPTRTSEPDLLEAPSLPSRPARPSTTSPARPSPMQKSSPPPRRPAALPQRNIPQISPASLASIHKYRQDGLNSYKRGDYAAAHTSYSSALSSTPDSHPLIITLLTNRALMALKVGDPKTAISDSDRAIFVIGPTKGESESIEFGNGEPAKDMREFFGKALMRKAEALEQLERWAEAAKIWREAVESGHGGSTSIQGRNRCEKADNHRREGPSSESSSAPRKPNRAPKPASRPPAAVSTKPSEAVNRLRAANQEADRADNEKFALSDSVDARLAAWKGGKQDNLRALLASLDTVLWPEAGWKKISMAELILPNKVKIQYMKGIGKVHPDKVCFSFLRFLFLICFHIANIIYPDPHQRNNGAENDLGGSLQHA